ncbi:MAG TPA: hypothetical protein VKV37_19265 [Ktedonobacteraceae bacterium]|nr:hypothetical protein [Ktedonobacteraceae bacterium]
MKLPFQLETELEAQICADPAWQRGARWGKPRPGHREGMALYHISEVLANVDRHATNAEERRKLRLVALLHDTFKYQCTPEEPDHETHACRFAARYLQDQAILELLELHERVSDAWRLGFYHKRPAEGRALLEELLERLEAHSILPLYLRFFRCDIQTASKNQAPLIWFERFLREKGREVPPQPFRYRRSLRQLPQRSVRWLRGRIRRLIRLSTGRLPDRQVTLSKHDWQQPKVEAPKP